MHEPESYAKAANDAKWRAVMEEEIHALTENETWDLVETPKGVNTDGYVNRYNPRLVSKGYAQQHDIDYDEMFAPIKKMITICVLLVAAATKG